MRTQNTAPQDATQVVDHIENRVIGAAEKSHDQNPPSR
jgi:hypothetical protein